ncbi:MAG: thiosulfate oxidation carrier protein SoxY [Lautropia sp.]|nr:thiosulfate oxidation carrier protein SoxY [Lautropia sp.]
MPHTTLSSLSECPEDGRNAGANGQEPHHGQQMISPHPVYARPPAIGRRQALLTGLGAAAMLGAGLGLSRPTRAQASTPAPMQPEGAGTAGTNPGTSAATNPGAHNGQDSHSARQAQLLEPNPVEFKREFDRFLAGKAPQSNGLKLEVPVLADNPSAVPVKVTVTLPITETDWCEELILLAEKNPIPLACRLFFTPLAGVAEAAVRVRLSQSQTLHALARMKRGQILVAKQDVTVAASGCGM